MSRFNDEFRSSLEIAALQSQKYLTGLADGPVGPAIGACELRRRLTKPLHDAGISSADVIDELCADVEGGLMNSGAGRFFGWVMGGALPSALAADWLTSTWDQCAANYTISPAAAIVEEVVGDWLKELLGLPPTSSFALVTGCQMAHFTCLASARNALLAKFDWDVEKRGLFGAPAIRIFTSDLLHGSAERAIRFIGIGIDQIIKLPTESDNKLRPELLEKALAEKQGPMIVILQAGEINTGAYDSFASLIPLAKKHGAWVHVDGAFGLWAAASPRYCHLVTGMDRADSWASDGHKWLNVPYDCGYAFVADNRAHREAMSHRAAYISYSAATRDAADWNPEWSRRARAFPTYAAIRQLGRLGIANLVDRCCDLAKLLTFEMGALPGVEILKVPEINQGLVRFLASGANSSDEDHDRRTKEVLAKICAGGDAYFSGSTWKGRRVLRISVCNWQTDEEDIARTIRGVQAAMR